MNHFIKYNIRRHGCYILQIKPAKIFRLKLPKARINEGIRPPIFGHFLDIQKCPFWPLCVGVLKYEMQTTKKWSCDHNAHKTRFRSEKHVTDFFRGVDGGVRIGGLKSDIYV